MSILSDKISIPLSLSPPSFPFSPHSASSPHSPSFLSLSLLPLPSSTPLLCPQHCMDFRNYSSVMAIVAGLGSSPIRRLHRTWEGVSKQHMELYKHMDAILDTRVGGNSGRSVHSVITPNMQLIPRLIKRCFLGVQSLANLQPSFMALMAIYIYIYKR